MTATNHVVTGALIAATITNPLIALPVALLSHPILDMIPHFNMLYSPEVLKPSFLIILLTDMSLAASVLLAILISRPDHYLIILACAILAASPDLMALPEFFDVMRHRQHRFGRVQTFLKKIQWSETTKGIIPEVVWLSVVGTILLQKLT